MNILLESPVFTLEAALKAAKVGVDRLELCSSFGEGGETPGPGMLSYLKKTIDIPVFVMIRPRGGDFVYSSDEIDVMAEEIRVFTSLGADGFVFGCLTPDGTVDEKACRRLIHSTKGKPCTFHRAFDLVPDPFASLETIIQLGFNRILTSGGRPTVSDGLNQIRQLLTTAGKKITIMPGGGTRPEHIKPLAETGELREIHASCKTWRPSKMKSHNSEVVFSSNDQQENHVISFDAQKYSMFRESIKEIA